MFNKKLKKFGLPVLALAGMMLFVGVPNADAAVHFGVYLGAPYAYPYAYGNPYGYPYAYPNYDYPYGYGYYSYPYYGGGYYGYWGGHQIMIGAATITTAVGAITVMIVDSAAENAVVADTVDSMAEEAMGTAGS